MNERESSLKSRAHSITRAIYGFGLIFITVFDLVPSKALNQAALAQPRTVLATHGTWEASMSTSQSEISCGVTSIPAGPGLLAITISKENIGMIQFSMIQMDWQLQRGFTTQAVIVAPNNHPMTVSMKGDGVNLTANIPRDSSTAGELITRFASNPFLRFDFPGTPGGAWTVATEGAGPTLRAMNTCLRLNGLSQYPRVKNDHD